MADAGRRLAFLFPGQGSQSVGMGRDWYEQTEIGRSVFDQADALLASSGFSLSRVCFEGPEEELRRTDRAQVGLFACSAIVLQFLTNAGLRPAVVAGHSLGEYSALLAAGTFDLATGLSLVRARGEAMWEAAEARPGAMAAILGMEPARVEALCREVAQGEIVQVANFNSPGQTVVSGERAAVERVSNAAPGAGARRAVLLPVHGAFHSRLMESAVSRMEVALGEVTLADPQVPFLANTEGDFVTDGAAVGRGLARQIVHCVRWTEIMRKIAAMKVEAAIEVGPGRVLCGLWRQSAAEIPAHPCGTVEQARTLVEQLS